jgi:hypothetical protein
LRKSRNRSILENQKISGHNHGQGDGIDGIAEVIFRAGLLAAFSLLCIGSCIPLINVLQLYHTNNGFYYCRTSLYSTEPDRHKDQPQHSDVPWMFLAVVDISNRLSEAQLQ